MKRFGMAAVVVGLLFGGAAIAQDPEAPARALWTESSREAKTNLLTGYMMGVARGAAYGSAYALREICRGATSEDREAVRTACDLYEENMIARGVLRFLSFEDHHGADDAIAAIDGFYDDPELKDVPWAYLIPAAVAKLNGKDYSEELATAKAQAASR